MNEFVIELKEYCKQLDNKRLNRISRLLRRIENLPMCDSVHLMCCEAVFMLFEEFGSVPSHLHARVILGEPNFWSREYISYLGNG